MKRHLLKGYAATEVGSLPELDEQYSESLRYLETLAARVGMFSHTTY